MTKIKSKVIEDDILLHDEDDKLLLKEIDKGEAIRKYEASANISSI